ncbi:MAG: Lrp/AsnC ligand binding domain-containing protein [Candidatus Thorarchaeota archaeon]|nr:Lrp/AsnC ligand binding domain-containing protein [Candidatus Thorarchaeota archaeon]
MMKRIGAYILMDIEISKTDEVVSKLREIEQARRISVTTGDYDIVLLLDVQDLEELYDITVQKIAHIPGIRETTTSVVEKVIAKE